MKTPLRVSTTTIESFRRLLTYDYVQEHELAAKIRGQVAENAKMAGGKAFHHVLQHFEELCQMQQHAELLDIVPEETGGPPREGPIKQVRWEKFVFTQNDVHAARDRIGDDGLWEVKCTQTFDTAYGPCVVVAKADNVRGYLIQDSKCKFGTSIESRDYEYDLQWRWYLLIHRAKAFKYNAFRFNELRDPEPDGLYYPVLKESYSCSFFPYEDMERDCVFWLHEFLGWAHSKKLTPFLYREGTD